jgi:uncharacterized membrane protein YfcA
MSDATGIGLPGLALLAAVSGVAAAVNSVAGGGTILTFPVLAALLPPGPGRMVSANATSTIGLWPGALAAAWAYRAERVGQPGWARWLLLPSVAGAVLGAWLVLWLPPTLFARLVPWLILLSAVLFALQPRLVGRRGRAAATASAVEPASPAGGRILLACLLQLAVGIYGGYFGAGIGILMLAMLGLLDLGDIHRLNGIKNVLGTAINGVAAAVFATGSLAGGQQVSWPCVASMVAGSVAGGLAGALLARRMPPSRVRRLVAVIGFALAGYYLWRHSLT